MPEQNISKKQSQILNNLIIIIGFSIPLIALFIDFVYKDVPKSINGFFYLYKLNPIHWLLLSTPFFSLLILRLLRKSELIFSESYEKIRNEEDKKNQKIQQLAKSLINEEEIDFELKDKNDFLGKTLLELKDYLSQNREAEKTRRKEDDQRTWVAEGLAKFSDILRKDNDNIEELSYNIISELVNYLGANQGGFYTLNDQDTKDLHFEMTACYAYERKKYSEKRIEWGEGLVGSAALEKQTIHMTKIPDSYLDITSGLGKANPKSLLIVPLIVNEELHGIMEVASFKDFEQYQVDFTEKVAESIASTLSTVKINVRTAKLLKESREQAEVLATQEEQMRQNMEELQATQEEAARQAEKFISFTNSVNHTLIRAEYDTDGTLLYANTKFLKKLGYTSNSEVEGQHISIFINEKDKDWFFEIWDTLSKGGKHFEGDMKHVTKQGQDLWTMATYTCVRRDDSSVEKILFLAIDTTEQKKLSLDYEGEIKALNLSTIKVDYDTVGNIIGNNDEFLSISKYNKGELSDKTAFDFIEELEQESFKVNWEDLLKGRPFQGEYLVKTKLNEDRWLRSSYTPVFNMYNEVSKIIQISYDMTEEKLMKIEAAKQNEILKQQEEKLRESGKELSMRLEQAKLEMKHQFKEIETIKLRNERTLEGALDAIITIDKECKIGFFNKAAEELWGFDSMDVLNKDAQILFSEKNIKDDPFINGFVFPDKEKIIGKRQEVQITNKSGEDIPVLFLISGASVGQEHWYTAFIQNIEVELF